MMEVRTRGPPKSLFLFSRAQHTAQERSGQAAASAQGARRPSDPAGRRTRGSPPTAGANSGHPYPAARVLLAKKTTQGEGVATTPTPHAAVRAAHSRKARPCNGTGSPDGAIVRTVPP